MSQSKDMEWLIGGKKQKARAYNMLPTKDPLQSKGCTQIESEGMENCISVNGNKKAGVAKLRSNTQTK